MIYENMQYNVGSLGCINFCPWQFSTQRPQPAGWNSNHVLK